MAISDKFCPLSFCFVIPIPRASGHAPEARGIGMTTGQNFSGHSWPFLLICGGSFTIVT